MATFFGSRSYMWLFAPSSSLRQPNRRDKVSKIKYVIVVVSKENRLPNKTRTKNFSIKCLGYTLEYKYNYSDLIHI
jgi:hypothetical protein